MFLNINLICLGLDMIVRDDLGNVLDITKTSTTKLYEEHDKARKRIRNANVRLTYTSLLNKLTHCSLQSNHRASNVNNLHKSSNNLLVTIHAFVCQIQEDSDLLLALYDGTTLKAITENYVVKWGSNGLALDGDKHRVLFTDLSSQDLASSKIYLVCHAVRVGAMDAKVLDPKRGSIARRQSSLNMPRMGSTISIGSNGENGHNQMRRPFGVAAFDLTAMLRKEDDIKNTIDMPFVLCEKETMDNALRKLIAINDKSRIEWKLAVSVDVMHGDLKQVSFIDHILIFDCIFEISI